MLDYLVQDIRKQTKKLRKSLKKRGRKGPIRKKKTCRCKGKCSCKRGCVKCNKPRRKSVKYKQGG